MKKFTILTAITLIGAFYYFYLQTPIAEVIIPAKNILIVGTSADYPPYAQIDLNTGEIVGLEIDVINEIARRLDKKLQIKDMPFNSLIIELISGQIDLVAAGVCPNEERKKTVLFSHPYIEGDNNVIVSKKSNPAITSVQDLYGKSVAVNIGYTAESFLSQYNEINLIRLKSPSDGFMALQTDSVDAFAIAQSIFNKFLENQKNNSYYQSFSLPSSDACALVYAKNNSALQQEVDPVIDAMIEDGTMQAIKKKWGFE
ncbi:MAG: amino acid ABC transporter substrate-binding protein [Candidatus Dependentiae bacterium]|nr:amino acid ABC transporter substrate-binding protein [Candidatus Dependentiae bacterium]